MQKVIFDTDDISIIELFLYHTLLSIINVNYCTAVLERESEGLGAPEMYYRPYQITAKKKN